MMPLRLSIVLGLCLASAASARTLVLDNGTVERSFAEREGIWVTTGFDGPSGSLAIESEEFHLRGFDNEVWTARDFAAGNEPSITKKPDGTQELDVLYVRQSGRAYSTNAPLRVRVLHAARPGECVVRKRIELEFLPHAAIDRLEVERFAVQKPARWGGRGQPVYLDERWFAGLEHPAGHSRHTDGNSPAPDTHHFEMVGNYSYVDLEGRDREDEAKPGLTRLFHFPGWAKADGERWIIRSQTAVFGTGEARQGMELVFLDYLDTIRKKPRSFTHYNNWFDPAGKSLKGENFVNVWKAFREVVGPAGVHVDSMVPDNGWQNRVSIWQPSAGHFPSGMPDLERLGARLKDEGTRLGLWLSLDGTTCNIGWGEQMGYERARANRYFSRYFAHYCLAGTRYKTDLAAQLRALVRAGQLNYFKHDFNHLNCLAEGHGHAPTDRHGHEANVDAMIELLAICREENPDLYQNLTNWIWYSPWWLVHGDALWFLAGDDGFNGNTPELATRAMATTDRDTYMWRMWGKPDDRPLVPVSHLMTHGFVRNPGGQMESRQDTIADWADHVWMYYGRGVQMKEWYLTPSAMTPEHWKAVLDAHRWSTANFTALVSTVYVGGRPDDGYAYGYIGWDGDRGVLVARNPSPASQTLSVPCDESTWYRGKKGVKLQATVVYPYRDGWATSYRSGQTMVFELPGYATMAFEIEPGTPKSSTPAPVIAAAKVESTPKSVMIEWTVPSDANGRTDLLVIGRPVLPDLTVDGQPVAPARTSRSALNHFAGYARDGMPSTNARAWHMAGYDLRPYAGRTITIRYSPSAASETTAVESWILREEQAADGSGPRRATRAASPLVSIAANPVLRRPFTAAELASARSASLRIEAFGVNGGSFGAKEVVLNGEIVGRLPECGDEWTAVRIAVPPGTLKPVNEVVVRHNGQEDKFKFRGAELRIELASGDVLASGAQPAPQTSFGDWAHEEGKVFTSRDRSHPVELKF